MKKSKKVLLFVITIMLIFMVMTISASAKTVSGTFDNNLTWSYDTSTYTLSISGTGEMDLYYYDDSPWEEYKDSIKTIVIDSGVTSIGYSAFRDCTSLQSITIPNSVTTIDSSAFKSCTSLQSITIPDSVTTIDSRAFDNCTSLESITIPNSVTSIGNYAFSNCSSLENMYYNGTADDWVKISFDDYDSNPMEYAENEYFNGELVTNVVLSKDVTIINDYAFCCCNMTSITIPDSVTSIGDYAFSSCTSLANMYFTGTADDWAEITFGDYSNPMEYAENEYFNGELVTDVVLSEGITSINKYAFRGCNITSITIPDSVTSIGISAFRNCTSLESITIPDSVTSIGGSAFRNCTSLESITIPDSVQTVGGAVFYNCKSLKMVTLSKNLISIPSYEEGTILYGFFESCISLESITIPDSVTSIDNYAFLNCTSLESITLPDSVTSIESYTFCNCTSLESITLPDSVTYIGNGAFENCTSLENMYYNGTTDDWVKICFGDFYSNPMTYAKNEYFNGELVTDIVLSEGIISINKYAFHGCNMTSITIGDSVTSIGSSAFSSCTSLESITIGDSVTSIGDYAFKNCTSLESITIPDSVTSIGSSAFYNCESLQSITIPDSVTSIGAGAFYSCGNLQSITIGNGVTSISGEAFAGCYNLWHVLYTGTENQWSEISIGDNNSYLTSATLHCKVKNNVITETITKAPKCTENGTKDLSCSVCDAIKTDVAVFALGHDLHFTEIVAPTCQKNGYDAYSCNRCDYIEERNCVEMVEHNFKNGVCTYCDGLETDCVSSPHNYPDNYEKTWVISKPGANAIDLIFSEKTYTEKDYDIIYIYDANDNLVGKYSGDELSGACIKVYSNKAKIKLTSDDGGNYYGFSIKKVVTHSYDEEENICSWCGEFKPVESLHPYKGYTNETWTIYRKDADRITITFSPDSYLSYNDYLYIYDGDDNYCGSCSFDYHSSSPYTVTVDDDTVKIRLVSNSDNSNNYYGFKVTAIEVHKHTYSDWNIERQATCYDYGYRSRTCTECGDEFSEEVAPLGHDYATEYTIDYAPTCNSSGSKSQHCSRCDSTINETWIPSTGHSFNDDEYCTICDEYAWHYQISNGEVTITYYAGNKTEIVIPDEFEGYPVTRISSYAFSWNEKVVKVVIPDSVKYISSYAFSGCINLQEITIGKGVITIDNYAFESCSSLTSITIPKSVAIIGNYAFMYSNINTINGYKGSYAETYAKAKGFVFVALSDIPDGYTGLYKVNNVWRYVKNGELDNTFTGLVKYSGKWYHVKNGVKTTYTGLVKHTDGKWYYVKNGVKTSFNGLVKYNGKWYYVKSGVVDKSYTGLVKHTDGKYYYVKSGVKTSFNGLVKYNGKWYYVKSGVVNTSYTGLVKHTDGKWYYVKKGVKTSYTGTVTYNGKKYKVKNGVKV